MKDRGYHGTRACSRREHKGGDMRQKRWKKMKTRVIAILVALTLLTLMTGIAVADQINVFQPGSFVPGVNGAGSGNAVATIQLIPGGAAVTKDLCVWSFNQPANTVHTLTTAVAPLTGGLPGDILVTYSEKTNPSINLGVFAPGPRNWIQDMGAQIPGPTVWESLDVQFKAAPGVTPGNSYQVQITDNNGLPLTVQVTIVATTIPEFATIAIPVAGILGLFLFFNHRKRL